MRFHSIPFFTVALLICATSCTATNTEPSDGFRESFNNLPSGVPISIELSNPADGGVYPPGPLLVEGFATIGETTPVAQTNLSYLVDVSGSSSDPGGGCGGDYNGDAEFDTVLDCEIAALLEVNELAISSGTVAMVGAGVFGTGGAGADVEPGGGGEDWLTGPSSDLDGDAMIDIEEVLRSIHYGEILEFTYHRVALETSYGAGLEAMVPVLTADDQYRDILIMLSDGHNNAEPTVFEVLPTLPADTIVHTFALGPKASCDGGKQLGSLRDISDATGGSCTEVPDVSDLPMVLPEVIAAQLTGLELRVDGELVGIDSISEPMPLEGPATFKYSTTLLDLTPGVHELCATATGLDSLGTDSVSECAEIRINTDPVAACEDLVLEADDSCSADASIDAGSFDPDGDGVDCTLDPPGPYPIGATDVTMTCTDPDGGTSICEATVEVVNGTPLEIEMADDLKLWPPDHKSHEFSVDECFGQITNSCAGGAPDDPYAGLEFEIVSVTSDEHENDLGDGNTCDDAIMITGKTSFTVRSERTAHGDGRCYLATYRVTDAYGNQTYEVCEVTVPKAHNQTAVDSGCALCLDADGEGDDCGACPTVYEVCE